MVRRQARDIERKDDAEDYGKNKTGSRDDDRYEFAKDSDR